MKVSADTILAAARKELGYRESPAGSNKTKYGAAYGLNGNPWCAMFLWWLFRQCDAMELLPVITASCSALMRAARSKGCWVTENYRPGDLVIYDFPGGAGTDHCGIVESVTGSGVIAIEGNTSVGNDSNGGIVMRRERSKSMIVGAVRPAYLEKSVVLDNTPAEYAKEAVAWAVEKGILQGDQTGNLNLSQPCSRQQLMTFLWRFANVLKNNL